jgi:hypothetical protein
VAVRGEVRVEPPELLGAVVVLVELGGVMVSFSWAYVSLNSRWRCCKVR